MNEFTLDFFEQEMKIPFFPFVFLYFSNDVRMNFRKVMLFMHLIIILNLNLLNAFFKNAEVGARTFIGIFENSCVMVSRSISKNSWHAFCVSFSSAPTNPIRQISTNGGYNILFLREISLSKNAS